MDRSGLSLKWLEAFQSVARHGSVRDGAAALGLSVSTTSHHLSCLEREVGVALFDHARRPLRPTREGRVLLRRVDEATGLLRRGVAEVWNDDLRALTRPIRIALVEDFDTDLAPALAGEIADALPAAPLSLMSRPSHQVLDLLEAEEADLGVAAFAGPPPPGITETPLLRDPYIIAVPRRLGSAPRDLGAFLAANAGLPFLRYSKRQLIGRRIEAQLRRTGLTLPDRVECESTHTILSLVASGRGWAITTALTFARAGGYHGGISAGPMPGRGFARQMSLYARDDLPERLTGLAARVAAGTLERGVVAPILSAHPWLAGALVALAPETAPKPGAP